MTQRDQRLKHVANIRFGVAAIIAVLIGAFVVWPNYQELTEKNARIAELTQDNAKVESELAEERKQYRGLKEAYVEQASLDAAAIGEVLPSAPMQTEIVRALEETANALSTERQPILLKAVDFGKVVEEKDVDYLVLPFKMTINTNESGLMAILSALENTGLPVSDSVSGKRLLSVQEINVQIDDQFAPRDANALTKGPIDIDMLVNAYLLPDSSEAETK
jgi:hypothetical protein